MLIKESNLFVEELNNKDSENVLSNYYGITDIAGVNYDNLCEIVTSFN